MQIPRSIVLMAECEVVPPTDAPEVPVAQSLFTSVVSELEQHSQMIESWEREKGKEDEEEDPWVFAMPNESVESFLASFPPSSTEKSWISTEHNGRKKIIEEYYVKTVGSEGLPDKTKLAEAWEQCMPKSTESLTRILKEHKYGSGKWMIFAPATDVNEMWERIVEALWDGKLGHSAKVSGALTDASQSHVICVYVDPFWETAEMERVLAGLRACGVEDAIKFKPDGVSLLNIYKDNEFGIPPSFFSASKGSLVLQKQLGGSDTRRWCKNGSNCKHLKQGRCSYLHKDEDFVKKEVPEWRKVDEDGMMQQKPARGSRFGNPTRTAPRPELPPSKKDEKKKKEEAAKKSSAFAALTGIGDEDADAILEKQRKKLEKRAAKKAAEDAAIAEKARGDFEALKAGLGTGNWADEDEDEDENAETPVADEDDEEDEDGEDEDDEDEEDDEDDEDDEDEDGEKGTDGQGKAGESANAQPVPTPPPPPPVAEKKKEKTKTAEEEEAEALLAALDVKEETKEGGQSKAAAKRAKKKAEEEARKKAEGAESTTTSAPKEADQKGGADAEENEAPQKEAVGGEGGAPLSAEEIKARLKAKAEAAKKKAKPKTAAEVAAAEAAARPKDKKKAAPTWSSGGAKVGQKARGSDNKYQGE